LDSPEGEISSDWISPFLTIPMELCNKFQICFDIDVVAGLFITYPKVLYTPLESRLTELWSGYINAHAVIMYSIHIQGAIHVQINPKIEGVGAHCQVRGIQNLCGAEAEESPLICGQKALDH